MREIPCISLCDQENILEYSYKSDKKASTSS